MPLDVFRKNYQPLTNEQKDAIEAIKVHAEDLYDNLALLTSREGALAKTKLEECVMWAVKAITA